jgi:hypothetical protein
MAGNLCCGAAAPTLLIMQCNRYFKSYKNHNISISKMPDFKNEQD